MEQYKDLVADLAPYKKYLPLLKEYFTTNVEEKKVCDEMIKLLECKTDEAVAANMMYSRDALRNGGYTWQFDKAKLQRFFASLVAECEKQQNWTKKQWMEVAFSTARQLEQQQDKLAEERGKLQQTIMVAGFAAERGADKARLTAHDTKTRLRDFGRATRKLQGKSKGITTNDIQKLEAILNGKRTTDYQH